MISPEQKTALKIKGERYLTQFKKEAIQNNNLAASKHIFHEFIDYLKQLRQTPGAEDLVPYLFNQYCIAYKKVLSSFQK